MKKVLIALVSIVFLMVLSALGVFAFLESKVKGVIVPRVKEIIQNETALDVKFDKFNFSLWELIKLQPTIIITDLKIEEALECKKMLIRLYLNGLMSKKFLIKEITIDNAILRLEEDKNKQAHPKGVDLEKLSKPKKDIIAKDPSKPLINTDFSIEKIRLKNLELKNSRIEYFAYGVKDPFVFRDVDISLCGFNIGETDKTLAATYKFKSRIFGQSSTLIASGSLGPIPLDISTIPITGSQNLKLFIKELPMAMRKEGFAALIQGNDGEIKQNAGISGDLLKGISGQGNLEISKLVLGQTDASTITASSTIPLNFYFRMNSHPQLSLTSKDATLDLTSGEDHKVGKLNFNTKVIVDMLTGAMSGSSDGSLSGLDIEKTLDTFTDIRKKISGVFTVNNYQLSFNGKGEALSKSLNATGSVTISEGSLYILKSITKYKNITNQFIKNGAALTEKIAGTFASLDSDFNFDNENLVTNNIKIKASEGVSMTGNGTVKKGQWLVYDLDLVVPQLTKAIPIKIRGTLEKPSIYPDLKSMAIEQQKEIVNQAIKTGMNLVQSKIKEITKNGQMGAVNADQLKQELQKGLGNLLKQNINTKKTVPSTTIPETTPATTPANIPQQP
ncbi:MAG: hypothetical protein LW817_03345 [Candidatus Caenarcaniphilales bacterium]|nr:hypothetical protein [Candidatus Caenarcaniphilales bacterium]